MTSAIDNGQAAPRIAPVSSDEYREIYNSLFLVPLNPETDVINVSLTWARHPELMKAQQAYQNHLFRDSSLPRRDRELVILRTGWKCKSKYEFSQHTIISRTLGITDEEIVRVTHGPDAGWIAAESNLLQAVDELLDDVTISDLVWSELLKGYNTQQILDLILLVGRYWSIAATLNAVRVQLEPGKPGLPGHVLPGWE
jgi:4-carboxymuconolactone decarboxylase